MKLLVTGAWNDAQSHIDELKAHGAHVLFMQQEKDELPCDPSEIEGVICNGLFLHHDIHEFTSLKYIQLTSAGFDRVPLDYIKEHKIEIHNARGVYSVPMAEHAVMGVLDLYRRSSYYDNNKKNHTWQKRRDLRELNGKTVMIYGCGSVGTECAKRFKAFGCRLIGIDPFIRQSDDFEAIGNLNDSVLYLPDADIVIITVPLTEETHHFFNKEMIGMMNCEAVLVNISRGQTVDTSALIDALKSNKLYGAVLDVFESEPLSEDSPLWDMENAVITPHISFIGDGNSERLWKCIENHLYTQQ